MNTMPDGGGGRCHPFPCGEGRGPPARGDRPSIL